MKFALKLNIYCISKVIINEIVPTNVLYFTFEICHHLLIFKLLTFIAQLIFIRYYKAIKLV